MTYLFHFGCANSLYHVFPEKVMKAVTTAFDQLVFCMHNYVKKPEYLLLNCFTLYIFSPYFPRNVKKIFF